MALRADSYGTVAEVVPFFRYQLEGQSTFNSTTIPTLSEVEAIQDRVSGILNVYLRAEGFQTPINTTTADTTSKLACADWVVLNTAAVVELTLPGSGMGDGEGTRANTLMAVQKRAKMFAQEIRPGLEAIDATRLTRYSGGLEATNRPHIDLRTDRDNTDTISQPSFTKDLFDNS